MESHPKGRQSTDNGDHYKQGPHGIKSNIYSNEENVLNELFCWHASSFKSAVYRAYRSENFTVVQLHASLPILINTYHKSVFYLYLNLSFHLKNRIYKFNDIQFSFVYWKSMFFLSTLFFTACVLKNHDEIPIGSLCIR